MRASFRVLAVTAAALFLGAGSALAQPVYYGAVLSGTHEVPPNASPAAGVVTLALFDVGGTPTIAVAGAFEGLVANYTASHLHVAPLGQNGPVAHHLNASLNGDSRGGSYAAASNTFPVSASFVSSLQNGQVYLNVHSTTYPGGEIRGQLVPVPAVDGDLSDGLYLSLARKQNANGGFGPAIDVSEILFYPDLINEVLFIGVRGKLDTGNGNGIGVLLGFSGVAGVPAGTPMGNIGGGLIGGHFLGGATFTADFDVAYGFAVNPGGGSSSVYLDAARFVGTPAVDYLGETNQAGAVVLGPADPSDNGGGPAFFRQRTVAFAFNNAGAAHTGFEFAVPFAELGVTPEQAAALTSNTLSAAAFVVSSDAYFSDVMVPGNVTAGNLGFRPNFATGTVAGDCFCGGAGGPIGDGPYHATDRVTGLSNPSFPLTAPTALTQVKVGASLKAIWTNPAPAPARVNVYLRRGNGPWALIYNNRNRGSAAYAVPADTPPGVDYQVYVADEANPEVYAVSERFTIYDPAAVFTFQRPVAKQQFAIGSTRTVTWTAPSGAAGGTVALRLHDKVTRAVVASAVAPNTGAYAFPFSSALPAGGYYFTIASVENGAYTGKSAVFKLGVTEVTAPVAGATLVAGSTYAITWAAPTVSDPAAYAKVILKRAGFANLIISRTTPNTGSFSWTVPAGTTAAGDYFVQVVVYAGGVGHAAKSGLFAISGGNESAAPVATEHFRVPAGSGTDLATLAVAVAGLPDGAEVAAFAGERLVGAGRVVGGHATFDVRGTLLDAHLLEEGVPAEEALVEVEDGAALALRAWVDGAERALPVVAVRDADAPAGRPATALTFVDGTTLEVETGLVAAASSADGAAAFALEAAAPNPVRDGAALRFTLPDPAAVRLAVYDALGREVALLADGPMAAGVHTVRLDASAFPAGVYLVRLEAGASVATRRLTVAR